MRAGPSSLKKVARMTSNLTPAYAKFGSPEHRAAERPHDRTLRTGTRRHAVSGAGPAERTTGSYQSPEPDQVPSSGPQTPPTITDIRNPTGYATSTDGPTTPSTCSLPATTGLPVGGNGPDRPGHPSSVKLYVALGDSMSIDVYAGGPGRGAASLLYRNRDAEFPDWAGRDLASRGYTALDLTYDGATTTGVLQRQLPLLDRHPDLVTLTMGGNDLMGAYGDTTAAEAVIRGVAQRGEQILDHLTSRPGTAPRLVVTTVYDPSDGTGALPGGALPAWPDGPHLVTALNSVLTDLAARHDAMVADVHAHFHGHGATAGDPGQPDPRPANRDLWFCGVIEPNAWGAHEIRRTWWETLDRTGGLP